MSRFRVDRPLARFKFYSSRPRLRLTIEQTALAALPHTSSVEAAMVAESCGGQHILQQPRQVVR